MNKEKIELYAFLLLGILAGGIICLVLIRYIFPILAPFLIAWLIATLTDGPARRLSHRTHVSVKAVRLITSLTAALLVFSSVALLIWQLTAAAWRFLGDIREGNELYDVLIALTQPGYFVLWSRQ